MSAQLFVQMWGFGRVNDDEESEVGDISPGPGARSPLLTRALAKAAAFGRPSDRNISARCTVDLAAPCLNTYPHD